MTRKPISIIVQDQSSPTLASLPMIFDTLTDLGYTPSVLYRLSPQHRRLVSVLHALVLKRSKADG